MTAPARNIVLTLCGFVILASLAAYVATGAAFFTRYPSDEIEQTNEQDDLAALFAEDTGLSDEMGELKGVDNRFTFGLLPSGPGRDGLSVASVGGLSFAVAAASFFLARRRQKRDQNSAASPPGASANSDGDRSPS